MDRSRFYLASGPAKKIPRSASDHPSVSALMREAKAGEKPEDVIRRKCREMVSRAKKNGWSGPPFDPKILASLNDIKVEISDDSFDGEGRIFPRRGKVVIQCRQGVMLERQRFTICHELAHTCFPDMFEFIRNHGGPTEDAAHKKFENLCDIGAAELLMPHENFAADLAQTQVIMSQAVILKNLYIASIDATLKRIMDVTNHPCAAVFFTDMPFGEFLSINNRLRMKFFWKSRSFKGFFPRGMLLVKNSIVHFAKNETPTTPSPRETWWVNNQPRSYYVEPLKLPAINNNSDYPKIVALIHSKKPA